MEILPLEIAEDMKECAMSAGWSTSKERRGNKGEAGAKKIAWSDKAADFKKKSAGLLSPQTCDEIKSMFWFASWHTANTRKGYKGDAARDKSTVEEKYQSIVRRKEMSQKLASNVKEMGWYIAWYCANESWGYTGDSTRDKATYESYFRKIHGEVTVKSMSFFHDKARILKSKPAIVAEETLTNRTGAEQSMTFTFSTTKSKTKSVSHQIGFKFTVKSSFETNFLVEKNRIDISLETSYTHTSTLSFMTGETKTYTFPLKVPAYKTYTAKGIVHEAEMDVPFELELDFGGQCTRTFEGVWKGVAVCNVTHEVDEK